MLVELEIVKKVFTGSKIIEVLKMSINWSKNKEMWATLSKEERTIRRQHANDEYERKLKQEVADGKATVEYVMVR